jgi:fatty-acyl-CoA synthase
MADAARPATPTAPHTEVFRDALSPVVLLARSVRVFPARTAVVHGAQRWTYHRLGAEVSRMAGALRQAGVRAGDRVAILSPNTPWHLAAHFAAPLLGAPLVSVNIRLAPAEIAYILEHSGAKILLVDPELAPALDDVIPKLSELERVIEIADDGFPVREGRESYAEFAAGAVPVALESTLVDEESVLSINYTSGTTGKPKGVMYTHRGAYLNSFGQLSVQGLSVDSVFLWTLPMFHCNGWCLPWAVTAAGGTHVALRRVDPALVFRLIEQEGVTHFIGAPTVLLMLSGDPAAQGKRFDPPLRVATGGAPPSPTLLERMERLGIRITHVYGLTETYGPHAICEVQSDWAGLDAAGRARMLSRQGVPLLHGAHLRVVDEQMRDVPADGKTLGEVVMRGNNVMRGYYRDPDATAKAFAGGWFHSGDVGVMQPDGYIELRDRSKDIIISGGENISTIEVENALYQHPGVQECAVVGVPHEKWGEVPKAFVVPAPGAAVTEAELIAFVRERIAHFKCPHSVEFCELPKTATGKIQKFRLREKEWAGREKRIH